MNIYVFLLCYNESVLLPHTIKHYREYIPSCIITILDNNSTDNSIEIAKSFGCFIQTFSTDNILDENKQTYLKNNCWKHIQDGWIIVCDMDEFLCIREEELYAEYNKKTTLLSVQGIDMIGESNTLDLTDVDLQQIKKHIFFDVESKYICFYRKSILSINYQVGAHTCSPEGLIKFSSTVYYLKHMSILGLKYFINKMVNRYERSHKMRSKGMAIHYDNNIQNITNLYYEKVNKSIL